MALLAASTGITTVDITGGAPELNPSFRWLVSESRKLGMHVIDRCNLTVLFEPGQNDLAQFLADHEVEIVASLPCYTRENVDRQRGKGVFEKSVEGLRALNRVGYGRDARLTLNLMFNPGGASLPPPQEALELEYKRRLHEDFGVVFNRLFTLTNMPIQRFADFLRQTGRSEQYGKLLVDSFNPHAAAQVMCRDLLSVSWDGKIYDCDFNQMLEMPAPGWQTIWNIESFSALPSNEIATGEHCFGCTAGGGSSCGGSLSQS